MAKADQLHRSGMGIFRDSCALVPNVKACHGGEHVGDFPPFEHPYA